MGLDSRTLRARRSPRRLLGAIILLFVAAAIGYASRTWLATIFTVPDRSLAPQFEDGDRLLALRSQWIREWKRGMPVIAHMPDGSLVLRRIAALPGDSLRADSRGRLTSKGWRSRHTRDTWWLMGARTRTPQKGDTLDGGTLDGPMVDFASNLAQRQGISLFQIRNQFVLDTTILPETAVSRVQLRGKPLSPVLVKGMSWNELEVVRSSLAAIAGTPGLRLARILVDSSGIPLRIPVLEDQFFLVCDHPQDCPDSRQTGWFPASSLVGTPILRMKGLRLPTRVDS